MRTSAPPGEARKRPGPGRLEVEDDAAFAAVDGVEARAVSADRAGHPARRVAIGRLDLDDVRAHVA